MVAKAKITPLAIPERLVKDAETRAWSAGGLVAVKPFRPHVLGALSRESLAPPQRQRFESSLAEKVDWFGSRLLPVRYAAGDAAAVAAEMEALLAGGRRHPDRGRRGLARSARSRLRGARAAGRPHDPSRGARASGQPALDRATCAAARCSACPRAGCSPRPPPSTSCCRASWPASRPGPEVAALGHGGLLSRDSAYRFPPYRKSGARGELAE